MDRVEDPYVVVLPDTGFATVKNKNVIKVMTLMHARGWETVNTSFDSHVGLVALLKNPRAKRK